MASSDHLAGLKAAHAVATGESKVAIKGLIKKHEADRTERLNVVKAKKKAYSDKQKGK
jgi:hypothetical protein